MVSPRIDSLTALRFVAAALIVLHHSRGILWLPQHILHGVILDQGVSFFFVLSGFILTHVYPQLDDWPAIRRFWQARFARIWPGHVFAAALVLTLFWEWYGSLLQQPRQQGILLLNVALLQAWVPTREVFFSLNTVSWTISTELFFYLLFPWLIQAFEMTWKWKLGLAALLPVVLVIGCNLFALPADAGMPASAITRTGLLYIHPLARLFEFVLGMCTARAWRHITPRLRLSSGLATVLEALALGVAFLSMHMCTYVNLLVPVLGHAGPEYLVHAGSAAAFAFLIFVMACERGLVAKCLTWHVCVLAGEISYALYLLHQVVLRYYQTHAAAVAFIPQPLLYLVFLASVLGMSWLVWKVVEQPGRRLLTGRRSLRIRQRMV